MKRKPVGFLLWLCLPAILLAGCSRSSQQKETPATASTAAPAQTAAMVPARTAEPAPTATSPGVFINGRELSDQQLEFLIATYHYAPPAGHYWYDAMSGAWGVEGHETAGLILPGYDLGPLARDASNGNTGVFINGREINMAEAARLQRTFGAVYRGHWWLDGRTGNYGVEGNPMPLGNIIAAMQAQSGGRNGDNFWSSATARGNSAGGCSYVSVDGVTATSGCD
jgi:hypothetical protein